MALVPGARLGPYEIVAPLGAGGMGEVYRARDPKLNRDVALKVLPDAFAADPDRVARFGREAQVLASLNHPHIAHIYGFEESTPNGSPPGTVVRSLVMELVEGPTLAERLHPSAGAGRALPLDEALAVARQIAEALEAAHEQGIVHRDLKPANVKVRDDGTVKVLDFGLAKAFDGSGGPGGAGGAGGAAEQSPTITTPAMTMRGVILGTAAYMAPEQAKGRPVDRRADIWAFGCVLYEMLTGRPAFDGEDVTEILGSVVKMDPDWSALPAATPASIRTLIRRCLQKDRTKRLQHIGDARIEMAEAAADDGAAASVVPPIAPRSSTRLAWGVAAVAAIAAIAAGLAAWRPAPSPRQMILEIAAPLSSQQGSFAISPDGRFVAYTVRGDGGVEQLWLRPLDTSAARPLPNADGAAFPFWSPDSQSLAFFAGGQLKRMTLDGGLPQVITAAPNGREGAWNRDGVILFAPTVTSPLHRVPASGGTSQPATTIGDARGHRHPAFLPDGVHFVYTSNRSQGTTIELASLSDPVGRRLVDADLNTGARYVAGGFLLFVYQRTLYAQRFDAGTLLLSGERFVAISSGSGSGVASTPSASDGGVIVFRQQGSEGRQRLAWRDRAGKPLGPAFAFGGSEVEISPDGKRAAAVRNVGSGNNDLWVIDLQRGVPTRFTSQAGTELWPAWSADGTRLAYGKAGAPILERSLSGQDGKLLDNEQGLKYPSDWSRDGQYLMYFTIGGATAGDLWALPMTGDRKPFPVVNAAFNETRGQFSPDGKWVSYESDESGRYEIYVRPFNRPGVPVRISVSGGSEARWHPNGRELFYIAPGARMTAVGLRPSPDGSAMEADAPRELFATSIFRYGMQPVNTKIQYAVAPDGERFLINEELEGGSAPPLIVVLNWQPPAGH